MSGDWSKPTLTSTYANFVAEVDARFDDLAVGFDPAIGVPTNIPTGTIRWRSSANKWEKWNGTAWGDLASTYAISISGNAATVTNGLYTGDIGVKVPSPTGTGASGNWAINITGSAGSVTWANVGSKPNRTNYRTLDANLVPSLVAGQLAWANFGAGNTIFDASSGKSPDGTTLAGGNTNPEVVWAPTYGTLMGWNGEQTYGVRVDSCRIADTVGGISPAAIVRSVNSAAPDANGNVAITISAFPQGTALLFAQAAAPTGWTKQTTHNDKALRVVSGATGGSAGGSVAFSTVFGRTASDASSLSIAQLAAHTHTIPSGVGSGSSTVVWNSGTAGISLNSGSQGSGSTHSHGLDLRVQYVDVIIATKD